MSSPEDEDVDLATLQAQIDVSMAAATALVSNWINPALRNVPSSRLSEKEFEDSLRRPPRLGVGAPLPHSSVAATTREAARLKGRLTADSKKRRLDAENAPTNNLEADEDVEEGRGRAVKKRVKVDPFAPKGSKKKASSSANTPSTTNKKQNLENGEPIKINAEAFLPTSPLVSSPCSTTNHLLELETSPMKIDDLRSSTSSTLGEDAVNTTTTGTMASASESGGDDLAQLGSSVDLPSSHPPKSSILNLNGPPEEVTGDYNASPNKKKKRKRRKKKTATIEQQGLGNSAGEDDKP